MKTTKEEILMTALRLFARRGFDSVSTADIAGELGITKGALYRHFENKQAIFDGIWQKMVDLDAQRAHEDGVPAEKMEDNPRDYETADFGDFCEFTANQFTFWTEDEFASNFRRMVVLEQFKSPESSKLFQDVICAGPVEYSADLLQKMMDGGKLNEEAKKRGAKQLAMELFAPLQLAIQMADGGADKEELKTLLRRITEDFKERWTK